MISASSSLQILTVTRFLEMDYESIIKTICDILRLLEVDFVNL